MFPEAAHIELINNSLEFGGSSLSLGSLIKVLKSSFLPMGYVSSQYSDLIQKYFFLLMVIFNFNFFNSFENKFQKKDFYFKDICTFIINFC